MTIAETYLEAWFNQKKTISTEKLAKQTDPNVRVAKRKNPTGNTFTFSDGSIVTTMGVGNSFKIW